MIRGIAHVCFTASNLEASIEFYQNKLGLGHAFDFINDAGKRFGVYLHAGGRGFVEMFQGEVGAPAQNPSYRHMCLEVENIQEAVKALKAKGVEVTAPKLGSDHSWQAWIADPDGNRIELHAYTPESKQSAALKSS